MILFPFCCFRVRLSFGAQIARAEKKEQLRSLLEMKKTACADKVKGGKTIPKAGALNSHKHVFFHGQSQCWRAVVKKTKDGRRQIKHFRRKTDALAAVSEAFRQPVQALKKVQPGTGMQKTASLYEGVFVGWLGAPNRLALVLELLDWWMCQWEVTCCDHMSIACGHCYFADDVGQAVIIISSWKL